MNLPKFIADDVPLFDNLFIDLFPDCDEPENDNDELQIEYLVFRLRRLLKLQVIHEGVYNNPDWSEGV